jgi:hypothetical protein
MPVTRFIVGLVVLDVVQQMICRRRTALRHADGFMAAQAVAAVVLQDRMRSATTTRHAALAGRSTAMATGAVVC